MAFDLGKVKAKFEKFKQNIPKQLQNDAQRYFVKNYNAEQWDGVAWLPRKDRKNKRKLLVKTGTLRRALAGSKREATFSKIRFEVFVAGGYAQIHNEGGVINKKERKGVINFKINKQGQSRFSKLKKANFQQEVVFKAHSITIPKRKFLGHSKALEDILKNKIKSKLKKVFQGA